MKIGSLEIDLVALDRKFSSSLDRGIKQLEKFGKFGLQVVARNNPEFRKLHDTFGDVGLGIGLAADALTELTTGKGRLGLLDMIRDTRLLGHSFSVWAEVGLLEALQQLERLKVEAKVLFLDIFSFGDTTKQQVKLFADMTDRTKAFQDQIDLIFKRDPPPARVPDVSGAIEREKHEIERVIGLGGTTSTRRFATSFASGPTPARRAPGLTPEQRVLADIETGRRSPIEGPAREARPEAERLLEAFQTGARSPIGRTEREFQQDLLKEIQKVAKSTGEIASRGGTVAVW